MKRREFLQSTQSLLLLAAAGGIPGLSLFSPRVLAQEPDSYNGKYFVMIRVATGWDVTLGLDPKVHSDGSEQGDMFIEYRAEEIVQNGNVRFAPACAPLIPHAQDLAVINGVFMSNANVSHDANLDYMSTGDCEGHVADLPAEIAHCSSVGPFGVVFNKTLKRLNRTVMPTTIDNIVSMTNSLDFSTLGSFLAGLKSNDAFLQSENSLAQNSPIRTRLLEALKFQDAQINPPASANGNNGGDTTEIKDAIRAGAVLSAAFSSGAAHQGLIDVQTDLDTHSGHEGKHLRNQTAVWNSIAQIFSIFKNTPSNGGSLFDRTTFIVISEFARTPALNASGGKDHNPLTNSVLLAGAGIQGGTVVGQSHLITRRNSKTGDSRHVAGLIDYSTGAAPANKSEAHAKNFQFIFPENVAATVAQAVGVDRQKFGGAHPDTAALSTILRKA
jgi:uncharacterized protein (DUF1501 family)